MQMWKKRFIAIVAAAIALSGCTSTVTGQPAINAMQRTADDILGVMPEMKPIVQTLQISGSATTPDELLSLTYYFRVSCLQLQKGNLYADDQPVSGKWTSTQIRDDMALKGTNVNGNQATELAGAFDLTCDAS